MQFCDGNQTSRCGHFKGDQLKSCKFRGHFCDVAFTTDSMDLLEKIARIIKGIVGMPLKLGFTLPEMGLSDVRYTG